MQTMECHMVRAAADVSLPPIGPELVHCLDRVTDELRSVGADPVHVALRGDGRGLAVELGCVARDRIDASIEALGMFAIALGDAGLRFSGLRLS